MSKLPSTSNQQAIDVFVKCGFEVIRHKGSHIVLKRSDPFAQLVIPDQKELDTGDLRSINRQADLSADEFISKL